VAPSSSVCSLKRMPPVLRLRRVARIRLAGVHSCRPPSAPEPSASVLL
jgi:hypothetical protein